MARGRRKSRCVLSQKPSGKGISRRRDEAEELTVGFSNSEVVDGSQWSPYHTLGSVQDNSLGQGKKILAFPLIFICNYIFSISMIMYIFITSI